MSVCSFDEFLCKLLKLNSKLSLSCPVDYGTACSYGCCNNNNTDTVWVFLFSKCID